MKYRMVKVEKGGQVWFETEYRFCFFFWRPCYTFTDMKSGYTFAAQYDTWEAAAGSINRHRKSQTVAKRTVVRNY